MRATHQAAKTVSFVLALKGAVGVSVAALALFGVTVPLFGYETTATSQSAAAGIGAIVGALLAARG